mmetsp:Transcript_2158/g.4554  ORF Transcript_2158/g.4554 Transcript_2158/m.4554 type:complete len:279 (+) Transcript_2158:39-875(+)
MLRTTSAPETTLGSQGDAAQALEAALEVLPPVPAWLQGCWRREYIQQSFRAPKAVDKAEEGVALYLQGEHVCIDIRVNVVEQNHAAERGDAAASSEDYLDCFAGVAIEADGIINWHPIITSSSSVDLIDHSKVLSWLHQTSVDPTNTEDRGKVMEMRADDAGVVESWLEVDPEGGSERLEEKWDRVLELTGGDDDPENSHPPPAVAPHDCEETIKFSIDPNTGRPSFSAAIRVGRIAAIAARGIFAVGSVDLERRQVQVTFASTQAMVGAYVNMDEWL